MGLAEADDVTWNSFAIFVIENGLLAAQLVDHDQLPIDKPGSQQQATANDQAANACQLPHEVAKLVLSRLFDLVEL